jgi:hypothetical protein
MLSPTQEGQNAEKFQSLYGNVPRVRTPAIKWGYTARRVITMEWIEGVKLTNKQVRAFRSLVVAGVLAVAGVRMAFGWVGCELSCWLLAQDRLLACMVSHTVQSTQVYWCVCVARTGHGSGGSKRS